MRISIQHLYMWSAKEEIVYTLPQKYFNTTFVHVEHSSYNITQYYQANFNTTFVHVEHTPAIFVGDERDGFQYNICTCGAIILDRTII